MLLNNSTGVKVSIEEKSATFEITNAIPELVIFFVGAVGLILMLIKIPIKKGLLSNTQISEKLTMKCEYDEDIIMDFNKDNFNKNTHNGTYEPKTGTIALPLPVFWILKLSGILKRKASWELGANLEL
jgi:hypothetical protein